MKKYIQLVVLLFACYTINAQNKNANSIALKNGILELTDNVNNFSWANFKTTFPYFNGKYFAAIQFYQPLKNADKQRLVNEGITLLEYIGEGAFTCTIKKEVSREFLQSLQVRSIFSIPSSFKVAATLQRETFPDYAVKKTGTVDVMIAFSKAADFSEIIQDLTHKKFEIINTDWKLYHAIQLRVATDDLQQLASLPYIDYIHPIAPDDKALNDELTSNARSNVLNAPISKGGENLNGKGVVIGVGDNANVTSHVDIADRVINRAPYVFQNHGTQTSGIAAGAGLKDPLYKGVAPMATILSQLFNGIFKNAAQYVADFGMVVTNNSYGAIFGDCEYAGTYDLYSSVLDAQAFELPKLLHVFAAGNDGPINLVCPSNPFGYHSLLSGYQSSKNVIDVAWGDKIPQTSIGSSLGPSADGRIKPEIVASGSEVVSTAANNGYITDYGSSLSSPAVAGGAALLIEKYRLLHGGQNPQSGLIKALLMNGATDIGNPGPDFKSGYGWLNLIRSLDMIKAQRHIISTVGQGGVNNHSITIPAGTSQLKVMLYWHDPAAAVFAKHTLVNDLDLEIISPANGTVLPWILDTSIANLNNNAFRGVDHINNAEQITIDNPAAGSYTIRVKGTAVNMNPSQEYFIVYDFLPPVIDLTFPSVGEPLVPGETIQMNWDAWDNSSNTFTLQFSSNNGANWTDIDNAIASNSRQYTWVVPNVNTSNAKVRLSRNGTSLQDESMPFVIVAQPVLSLSATQCEGYFSFQWNAVAGANDYEVMMKQGPEMVPIATTTSTSYTMSGLRSDSNYWVTVRARISGEPGRRAIAINRTPNSGTCTGNISDNDLKADSILSPNSGRKYTSTEITSNQMVVRIKNLDDAPVTGFDVKYSINGSPFITENVSATIPALGSYNHTFNGVNFSNTGSYNIIAVVKKTGDVISANDTAQRTIQQLPNDTIFQHIENFESAPNFEVNGTRMGLPGLAKWDLITTTPYGRARSFLDTGFALNGTKAITLDVSRYVQAGNTNYLVGTFNLGWYFGLLEDPRYKLEFWYKNHGQEDHPDNRVWARPNESSPWVEIFNFDSARAFAGEWKKAGPIELSHLGAVGPYSSFQIRFGQHGIVGTADNETVQGLTLDSIKLFASRWDYSVLRIESPAKKSCGLGTAETLTIVTSSSDVAPSMIPVSYRLDGGPVVTESFFGGVGTYSFNQKLNLSVPGEHTIDVWISFFQDGNRTNDSIIGYKIINQPAISTFPYLENFENGKGYWYAEGHHSSWEYGTPESIKINKAASGSKAWKTSLVGTYNDDELSYLYSPCFNISSLTHPYLSFALAMDIEQCDQFVCDQAWMEYSTDGKTWNKLGNYGEGTNWYNRDGDNVWDSADFRRWHVASTPLPTGLSSVQFRFVMNSDGSLIKEGMAIDDIHIYDRLSPTYTGAPQSLVTNVANPSGHNWIDVNGMGPNTGLMVSINPNGNSFGSTNVQTFINTAAVRDTNQQYYLDRNFTIKPTNTILPDSSSIRLYFTDAEVDALVRATGCNTCSKPVDAWQLGVTKYDNIDRTKENGTLTDNVSGTYSYINNNRVKIVPYDLGYYAEFKVKNFSEFWLNNGGLNNNEALPLQLLQFTAVKKENDVLVKWETASEQNVDRYEIEVAVNSNDMAQQKFGLLGVVKANNLSQNSYSFTDRTENKKGIRYYRLKMIDQNGVSKYSEVRKVVFDGSVDWSVYPNPVKNRLYIIAPAETGERTTVQMTNASGQNVFIKIFTTNSSAEKIAIPLDQYQLSAGVYLLRVSAGEIVKWYKVIKTD